ncbi:MAG TPA: ATPase, T2SS/T4P/T4SS family [Ilumatobacter sp.]
MTPDPPLDELVDLVCAQARTIHGDVRTVVAGQVDQLAPLATARDRELVIARATARLDGLDALDEHLRDPRNDEVMVNRGREVWVDRDGRAQRAADLPEGAIDVVLERILSPLGKRLDRTTPIVDARLADGARICAVVAPIAVDGTTVSIRRHRPRRLPVDRFGDPGVVALLGEIVRRRANVLITGATSSGKTSLLAAMTGLADPHDRLVVIEDNAELVLGEAHAIRLEARPAGVDGLRAVDLAELVRTALRLRPDRLIVGEFRGPEVVAVLQALNTGHDGSLATCHANGPLDAVRRIETLVMQASPAWPLAAIRRQISRSIDVVIHLQRGSDGSRHVAQAVELVESDAEPSGRPLVTDRVVVDTLGRGRR